METHYRPFVPCLYPDVCKDCAGIPEGVNVHLVSGEKLEFRDIAGIELKDAEIVLHVKDGTEHRFHRSDVVYAGCSRVPPPVV